MTLKLGIVGACARGGSFRAGCEAAGLEIKAVCDINADALPAAAKQVGVTETYTDYQTMLEQSGIDAVIIGTPMHLHVPQSIAAVERGIHVLCEVTAGVTIEECKELVRACEKSEAIYMMAENYAYRRPNVLVRELVRQGLFGQPYYAEGEYIHELKTLNERTPWRRTWQSGIAGITYPTHALGPILQWMPGDRVVRVCCADTTTRLKDPRGEEYAQMTPVMLCKTAKGALIKIRVDCLSDRPHAMTNYSLQGIDGCYESSRGGPTERDKIWLRSLSADFRWHDASALADVDELAEKYLPEIWRNPPKSAKKAGHGGSDYFEVLDFAKAICGDVPTPIGIHEAMDMTLPGLISQRSALEDGRWIEVPDSRGWF
jgi:predicted dehydrogenase